MRRLLVTFTLIAGALALWPGFAHAQRVRTTPEKNVHIRETALPKTLKVAIRSSRPSGEPDPRGRIVWVKPVPFVDYVKDSLPNEWVPSWHPESLRAGAIAVKMFAWYHSLHPTTLDGFRYDVDNTVNFQTYREGRRHSLTSRAVDETWRQAFVERDGTVAPVYYRAGREDDPNYQYRNANKMAQWGSHYWARRGRSHVQILQFYYQGKVLVPIPRL